MNPNPKTEHLTQWQKGQPSPNPNGRKPKFITTFKKDGFTQSEINDVILQMLSMTETELNEVLTSTETTVFESIIARALQNSSKKGSLYAIESLLNRAIGLPKNNSEQPKENQIIFITMDLGQMAAQTNILTLNND